MPRQIHEFNVAMTCEGCSGAVERVLGKLKGQGVEKVEINLAGQQVLVYSDLPHNAILDQIKMTGKTVNYVGSKDDL